MARARNPVLVRDVLCDLPLRLAGSDLVLTDCGRYQNLATVRLGIDDEDESEDADLADLESSAW
jgi:hypothetical protein